MRIATWNVNSVKARMDRMLAWLRQHEPDVLCLQEIKLTDDKFPSMELSALGYASLTHGQKTYNGVAILSRTPPTEVRIGLDDGVADPQARLIAATVAGVRVLSAYVPNGATPDSDKFRYKLEWLERLVVYLDRHHTPSQPLVLCGDLNIAPDDSDVANPADWRDSVLCTAQVRDAFRRLIDWGLVDCLRQHHPAGGVYSWWDYRMLGFAKNDGLRIDHVLATPALAARCTACNVDREARKGPGPSDHAPVIADFSDP
jgi:exodeoxyribonuclease-3